MNPKIKNSIRDTVNSANSFAYALGASVASIFRMLLLSNVILAFKGKQIRSLKKNDSCTILANGPSLKAAFEQEEVIIENCDIVCMNSFCESDYFWKIKPFFYFLVDGQFFNPTNERCINQVNSIKSALAKVDWPMLLVISTSSASGGVLEDLSNPFINLVRLNTTSIKGFKFFSHFFLRHFLGMSVCQTVTNMALCASVQMGYKNIYLYGADHSWTKDLRVDDNNVVCYGDRHVYNTSLTEIKLGDSIANLLRQYSQMFESHWAINDFAKSAGAKIWNCTKDSFIDAYERKL